MFRCSCGARPKLTAPGAVIGALVSEDVYALLVNCHECGSTRSAIMWQSEDFAAFELEEDAGAELYFEQELPLDRATHRGFFSIANELAERGL